MPPRKYLVPLSRVLWLVHTADDEAAVATALRLCHRFGQRHPRSSTRGGRTGTSSARFLALPPEIKRVIYTTNLVKPVNARLRTSHPQPRPSSSEQAALKVLYLTVRKLEEFRRPNVGSTVRAGNRCCSVHDLPRQANPKPVTDAAITYRRSDAP